MALPLFSQQQDTLDEILGRGLGTGIGSGVQQLAQSNLDRMLGRSNYFQQNLNQVLRDIAPKQQPILNNLAPVQQQQAQITQQEPIQQQQPQETQKLTPAQQMKRQEFDFRVSKEARNWLQEYKTRAQEADTLKSDLKMMSKAARSGQLYTGTTQRLAERLGFKELTTNNASQIYDKLASEVRVHLAKVALPKGSRITNMVEQLVGKTVPGREMDVPAIIALSDAGEKLMELAELEYQEADKKLSEWGGKLPYNANSQVDKVLEKRKKELRKEAEGILHKGIKGEIPIREPEVGSFFKSMADVPTQDLKIGRRGKNHTTGKIYEWNGKEWKEVTGE